MDSVLSNVQRSTYQHFPYFMSRQQSVDKCIQTRVSSHSTRGECGPQNAAVFASGCIMK